MSDVEIVTRTMDSEKTVIRRWPSGVAASKPSSFFVREDIFPNRLLRLLAIQVWLMGQVMAKIRLNQKFTVIKFRKRLRLYLALGVADGAVANNEPGL